MRISAETGHTQVPFTTSRGVETTVDAGMYTTLMYLKDMGVETQWSCEGDDFGAYFLADLYTGMRFFRKLLFKRGLSKPAKYMRRKLLHGVWEFETAWFKGEGNDRVFYSKMAIGNPRHDRPPSKRYELEFTASNVHKLRLVVRWPTDLTWLMSQLMYELALQTTT